MSMRWNHRVVRVKDGADATLMLCEVFADMNRGEFIGRNDGARIVGDNQGELLWVMERMRKALDKPILEDKWPQVSDGK